MYVPNGANIYIDSITPTKAYLHPSCNLKQIPYRLNRYYLNHRN